MKIKSLKTINFREKPDRLKKKAKTRSQDYLKMYIDFVTGKKRTRSKTIYRKERMLMKRVG